MRYTALRMMLYLLCIVLILNGCQLAKKKETAITLTINYPSQQQFLKDYGFAFEQKYPNISINVLPDDLKDPELSPISDVIFMNSMSLYNKNIDTGKLLELNEKGAKAKKELDKFSPIVTTMLRSAPENNQIFGLAPMFQSKALYYNKKLFNDYGIPYPTNHMSWKEVSELAMRFPSETHSGKPLYGLEVDYDREIYLNILLEMGLTSGLSYLNPDTLQVSINTDEWRTVWTEAVDAFRSGKIYGNRIAEGSMDPPQFLTESAGMFIASNQAAYNFKSFSDYNGGSTTIDWDMVTVPIDPLNPTISRSYSISNVFGVSQATSFPKEAWELVKFVAGDTNNSRYLATIQSGGLPAVTDYINPISGHDLSPLYSLNAINDVPNPYAILNATIPNSFLTAVQPILEDLILNNLTMDEALSKAQASGQQAVDEAALVIKK